MQKEYRIKFLKSDTFYNAILIFGVLIYFLYMAIKEGKGIFPMLIVFGLIAIIFSFAYFYFSRLRVFIDNDYLVIKTIDKTTKIVAKNIYKIEKALGWGAMSYCIFYRNEHNKKRTAYIPDDMEDCQKILDYINKQSGIQAKWEILNFGKDTNIFKKIFRIILFILVYLVLFGLPLWYIFFRK